MRLIDADSIQEELAALILYSAGTPEGECIDYAHNLIDAQPVIDAEPVKHARWIDPVHGVYKCSNCRSLLDFEGVNAGRGDANYCPHCGAKMDNETEGE